MKVYDVYLDDGENTYKITVPAETEKSAEKYVLGNGEIIAIRENPIVQDIDLEFLTEVLKRNAYGKTEIDVIIRCLDSCDLRR